MVVRTYYITGINRAHKTAHILQSQMQLLFFSDLSRESRYSLVTCFSQGLAPVFPRMTYHRRPPSMPCPPARPCVWLRLYLPSRAGCHFARSKNLSAAARQAHSSARVAQALRAAAACRSTSCSTLRLRLRPTYTIAKKSTRHPGEPRQSAMLCL